MKTFFHLSLLTLSMSVIGTSAQAVVIDAYACPKTANEVQVYEIEKRVTIARNSAGAIEEMYLGCSASITSLQGGISHIHLSLPIEACNTSACQSEKMSLTLDSIQTNIASATQKKYENYLIRQEKVQKIAKVKEPILDQAWTEGWSRSKYLKALKNALEAADLL